MHEAVWWKLIAKASGSESPIPHLLSSCVSVCAAAAFQREKRVRVYETDNAFKLRKVILSETPACWKAAGMPAIACQAHLCMAHTPEVMAGRQAGTCMMSGGVSTWTLHYVVGIW